MYKSEYNSVYYTVLRYISMIALFAIINDARSRGMMAVCKEEQFSRNASPVLFPCKIIR